MKGKTFHFRGGVHPTANKHTSECAIRRFPMPAKLHIPLQQHIGAPAEPLVEVGQQVLKGELLANSQGVISAPVHAPTSGTIRVIDDLDAPHPSGLPVRTIVLEADGMDAWKPAAGIDNPFMRAPEEIAAMVGAAGIVGMGGATFPAAVKLHLAMQQTVHTLIINGGECEPYLTCDDRLMQERAEGIITGVRIFKHVLKPVRTVIAIENNKPAAFAAMQEANRALYKIEIVQVPSRYPMGSEKQMIQAITGREIPAARRAIDAGVVVHNVATAYAAYEAVQLGRPLVSRIVTVTGGAIRQPMNLEVPIGTLLQDLLDYCGLNSQPQRLLLGGPMMGQVVPHTRVPVVKGSNGVIALTATDLHRQESRACIRCARCVSVCPMGLLPLEMAARLNKGNIDGALSYGLLDCISCGSCSYVCPSNIPLAHFFNYGKGEHAARQDQERFNDVTKKLAAQKKQRLTRQAEEKQRARSKSA